MKWNHFIEININLSKVTHLSFFSDTSDPPFNSCNQTPFHAYLKDNETMAWCTMLLFECRTLWDSAHFLSHPSSIYVVNCEVERGFHLSRRKLNRLNIPLLETGGDWRGLRTAFPWCRMHLNIDINTIDRVSDMVWVSV